MTIAHTPHPYRCPKCSTTYCPTCAALEARAPLPAPPPSRPIWCPDGKVRDALRRSPHSPVTGPARPRFVGEVYRDMLGGLELEGGLPLPEDLRLEVVRLSSASKCRPPLTSAEIAEALRDGEASDA